MQSNHSNTSDYLNQIKHEFEASFTTHQNVKKGFIITLQFD